MPFQFIPNAVRLPSGHHADWQQTKEMLAAGEINARHIRDPPSVQLKRYYKSRSSHPSHSELQRLAREVMNHEGDVELVDEWFADRRMKAFQKVEDAKAKAKEVENSASVIEDMLSIVDRIVFR